MIKDYFDQVADSIESIFSDFDDELISAQFGDRFLIYLSFVYDMCRKYSKMLEDV